MEFIEGRQNPFDRSAPFSKIPFPKQERKQISKNYECLLYKPTLQTCKGANSPTYSMRSQMCQKEEDQRRKYNQKREKLSKCLIQSQNRKVWGNPFYRKNLLISEQKVKEQIQSDLGYISTLDDLSNPFNDTYQQNRQFEDTYHYSLKSSKYAHEHNLTQNNFQTEQQYTFIEKKSISDKQSPRQSYHYQKHEGRQEKAQNDADGEDKNQENGEQQRGKYLEQIIVRGKQYFQNTVHHKYDHQN